MNTTFEVTAKEDARIRKIGEYLTSTAIFVRVVDSFGRSHEVRFCDYAEKFTVLQNA